MVAKNISTPDPDSSLESISRAVFQESIDSDTTDALIEVVSQQIELLTFDSEDTALLYRLVESCGDRREKIQLRLVELFSEIGEDATPVLVEALSNHPNEIVRRACAKALAKLGDADAIPALVQALLNDPDPITQSSASGALARMGAPAIPELLEVIASPSYPDAQKGQAAWALSCLGPEAAEDLYAAANSEIPDVRCAVIGAIAAISKHQRPPFPGIQILLNALHDSVSAVRLEAASGLGKLLHYNATQKLIPLLTDNDPEVRKTTALALGSLKDANALDALKAIEMDPSDIVKPVVLWAIQQLQP
ncbi:MAG: HEAT repeat domain-containing protein [Cyanobacteria bacterium P01_F01_bin.150]